MGHDEVIRVEALAGEIFGVVNLFYELSVCYDWHDIDSSHLNIVS